MFILNSSSLSLGIDKNISCNFYLSSASSIFYFSSYTKSLIGSIGGGGGGSSYCIGSKAGSGGFISFSYSFFI